MAVLASTQTVTGTTTTVYTVETTVAFGGMPVSSSKVITPAITASYDSSVTVTVANTTAAYAINRLETLVYKLSATTKVTITEPGTTPGTGQVYTVDPVTAVAMTSGDVWSLTATTGTVTGAWDSVVITITVS